MNDAFGRPRSALVLGGGSEIGLRVLARLAVGGLERVLLAGPDPASMAERAEALAADGVEVATVEWDARQGVPDSLLAAVTGFGDIDLVLCAAGLLGHAAGAASGPDRVRELADVNFTGPASALAALVPLLVAQGHGDIVVLSSVAALRPRRSNFAYGAAKAGLDAWARGLGDALDDSGVRVHVVRAGFVHTRMTTGLHAAPFSTTSDVVAAAVVGVLGSRRNRIVHVPAVIGPLFAGLRLLPAPLWRRVAGDR